MDAFINSASELSRILMPILGVVALVILIMILLNVLKIVSKSVESIDNVDKLLVDVDKTVEKIQAPVETVAKVFKTVDTVHDASLNAAGQVKDFVVENIDVIKTKINNLKKEDSIKEDIIHKDESEVVYEENNNL